MKALSTICLSLCLIAPAYAAGAQAAEDPAARYERDPLPTSRRGDEPAIQELPPEPLAPAVAAPVPVIQAAPALRAPGVDRRERRANALAAPDDYLDPAWPSDGSEMRITPQQSDSVEEAPLEDQALDEAERQEAEKYREALGHYKDPDEFTQDNWGEDPGDRTRSRDVQEYEDPAEW